MSRVTRVLGRSALIAFSLAACGREDGSTRANDPVLEALPAEGVPECLHETELTAGPLTVVARLEDPLACEGGDIELDVTWADGRTQHLEIGRFGYPTDLWPVDLAEDGVADLVVGHQDLTGNPPRIRVYRDEAGGLREVVVPELTSAVLDGYQGGGNFHTRAGDLFFSWTHAAERSLRMVRLDLPSRRWANVDPDRYETDRPR